MTPAEGNQTHNVTLWVNAVCETGTGVNCTALNGFVNPCGSAGCTVTAQCVENADVPVTFNFTVMASAQQGFFDIAVNFDNVFCSAKLDSCYGDGEYPADAINLLFDIDPDSDTYGQRVHTAVAAVACSAGPGETTHLHMTSMWIECGEAAEAQDYLLQFAGITQEGNLLVPNVDPNADPLAAAIYFGTEDLPGQSKVFTNVAFVLPTDADGNGLGCSVRWFVVPSTSATPPQPDDGTGGTYTQVAGVFFDSDEAFVTAGQCDQHPLNEDGSGVVTDYFEGDGEHEFWDEEIPYDGTLVIGSTGFVGAGDGGGDDVPVGIEVGDRCSVGVHEPCVIGSGNDEAFCYSDPEGGNYCTIPCDALDGPDFCSDAFGGLGPAYCNGNPGFCVKD